MIEENFYHVVLNNHRYLIRVLKAGGNWTFIVSISFFFIFIFLILNLNFIILVRIFDENLCLKIIQEIIVKFYHITNIICDFAFVMTQNRDYTIKIICIANDIYNRYKYHWEFVKVCRIWYVSEIYITLIISSLREIYNEANVFHLIWNYVSYILI